MRFMKRAFVFYTVAIILSLTICGLTTYAIYTIMGYYGLYYVGDMLSFQIALAVAEAASLSSVVYGLSQKVLLDDEDDFEDQAEFEEL